MLFIYNVCCICVVAAILLLYISWLDWNKWMEWLNWIETMVYKLISNSWGVKCEDEKTWQNWIIWFVNIAKGLNCFICCFNHRNIWGFWFCALKGVGALDGAAFVVVVMFLLCVFVIMN